MAALFDRPDGGLVLAVLVICVGGLLFLGLFSLLQRHDFRRRDTGRTWWSRKSQRYDGPEPPANRAVAMSASAYPPEPAGDEPEEATDVEQPAVAVTEPPAETKTPGRHRRATPNAAKRAAPAKKATTRKTTSRVNKPED